MCAQVVSYCTIACQREHWKHHKRECGKVRPSDADSARASGAESVNVDSSKNSTAAPAATTRDADGQSVILKITELELNKNRLFAMMKASSGQAYGTLMNPYSPNGDDPCIPNVHGKKRCVLPFWILVNSCCSSTIDLWVLHVAVCWLIGMR